MCDYETAIAVARKYLEHTPRTRHEVEVRLRRASIDPVTIASVMGVLERAGLVDDRAFAAAWVESRSRSKGYGRVRLESELRRKGVDSEIIGEALAQLGADCELDRALTAARSLVGTADTADPGVRRRLAGYLHRRGYSWDTIEQVVSDIASNTDS